MVSAGDIVLSKKGRDKNKYFLVVKVCDGDAFITDGRKRKVTALKKKNVKHLESIVVAGLKDVATNIDKGCTVGNDKVFRAIKTLVQNKQED